MGFGYLFLGYLVAFLLHTAANALGVGSFAMILGCALMWTGLRSLRLFCKGFVWAEYALYPMLAMGVYRLMGDLSDLFLWDLTFFSKASTAASWIEFCLIMIFHAALLSAIREIGMQVELKKIASAAIRNMIIVFLYAATYALYWIPNLVGETVRGYLTLSITLLNLAWILCDLWLLLTCTKDIVPEGQEEPEIKRYRWEVLNRIGDRFDENMKKAAESNRAAIEENLRKKQERRNGSSEAASEVRSPKKKKRKK